METFTVTFEVGSTRDGPFEEIEALVDTGASYSLVPRPVLERLGVEPSDSDRIMLAEGRILQQDLGEAVIRIDGRARTRVVVFGPPDAQPLLGADTLEGFLLAVDPHRKVLVPARGYLAAER